MIGGQETYIHILNKILHKHNYQPYVLQPFNRSIDTPKNVIMLPFIPFLNAFFSPWLTTNFLVRFLKKRLLQFDLLISHYALHYNSVRKNKNVIVVSHGTDWHDPPITKLDKARYKAAMGLKNMKENRPIIVANDTHFLQKIGINIIISNTMS